MKYAVQNDPTGTRPRQVHKFTDSIYRTRWLQGDLETRRPCQWADVSKQIRVAETHAPHDAWEAISATHQALRHTPEPQDRRRANRPIPANLPPATFPVVEIDPLSPRQCLALALWAEFENPVAVADRMGITPSTAYVALHAIRRKLALFESRDVFDAYHTARLEQRRREEIRRANREILRK